MFFFSKQGRREREGKGGGVGRKLTHYFLEQKIFFPHKNFPHLNNMWGFIYWTRH